MQVLMDLVNKQQEQIALLAKQVPVSEDLRKEIHNTEVSAHQQQQLTHGLDPNMVLWLQK